MTLDAYRTLYDSSVTFGIRKQMQAELGMPELEAEISELSERKRTLEAQVLALRNKIEVVERRQVGNGHGYNQWREHAGGSFSLSFLRFSLNKLQAERRLLEDKRRQEEVAYLKHQAKHLDLFLKAMPKL
jgi:dynein light intermediate chain, axonemal